MVPNKIDHSAYHANVAAVDSLLTIHGGWCSGEVTEEHAV